MGSSCEYFLGGRGNLRFLHWAGNWSLCLVEMSFRTLDNFLCEYVHSGC